jgi:hypothetical protein
LRSLLALLATLLVGTALGLAATRWTASNRQGFSAEQAGPWIAWPKAGTSEAEPYARAFQARTGYVPLGGGDGVALFALSDSEGRPLEGDCAYDVGGAVPAARFWTLEAFSPKGRPVAGPLGRFGFTSAEVMHDAAGHFMVAVSPQVRPGNWLQVTTHGRFVLVLRLYETVLSASAFSLEADALPAITRGACR